MILIKYDENDLQQKLLYNAYCMTTHDGFSDFENRDDFEVFFS